MNRKIALIVLISLALTALSAQEKSFGMKVVSPGGAPALALASLAAENPGDFTYIAAETIAAEFSGRKADFIIAPVNAGATLYKARKSSYKLAAVVTWGNLHFASQRKNFDVKNISGAEITLFGENTINSSVALSVLEKNKIMPKNVRYLAGAANTESLLLSDKDAIVLTAEPALSAAKMKNPRITSYALNDLSRKAGGFDGFAQAGLFVRAETAESRPDEVGRFLRLAAESCAKCANDVASVAKAAVALEILPGEKVAASAIPNCAIRFMSAKDARAQVEATARIDLAQFGGEIPADDFYYAD